MSSSTSSSIHSKSQPLHERTNSEKNKQQIRLVPYTPPKIEAEETGSHVESKAAGSGGASPTIKDPFGPSTPLRRERLPGSAVSSPPSSSSSTTSLAWVRAKNVSDSPFSLDSTGSGHPTPPPPAIVRTPHGSPVRRFNAPAQQSRTQRENVPATRSRPVSRRDRYITINSDKTFSIVLKSNDVRASTGSEAESHSQLYSNTSGFSSHEGTSFAPTEDQPSSLFSSLPERSVSPSSPDNSAAPLKVTETQSGPSPWNCRMVGGVRKVPKTPEAKDKGKGKELAIESQPPLPPLPETITNFSRVATSSLNQKSSFSTEDSDSAPEPQLPSLAPKHSFSTDQSGSTLERTSNYKVLGRSSPPLPDSDSIDIPPSSSDSNYQLIGQSSAGQSLASSPTRPHALLDTPGSKNYIVHGNPYAPSEQSSLDTPGSKNFIVHGNATPSPWTTPYGRTPRSQGSYDSFKPRMREQYSQESLLIPPLRPHKRASSENLYLQRASRESSVHGRANSYSTISSVLTQDTTPNVVRLAHTPSASSLRQTPWASLSRGGSQRLRMERMDLHQWSSQLSTVLSEYEGSEGGSRMASLGSQGDRGSSGLASRTASRHIPSISTSMFENLEAARPTSQAHSRSGSLDRPGAGFIRGPRDLPGPPIRTVRDHDEHGDGLADLNQTHTLQTKSSWTRLGFLSRQSSDRSLRSLASSRTGSFTNSLPAWARFYYGGGDTRWLGTPSIISEDDDYPLPSSYLSPRPPTREQFGQDNNNPRPRPREVQPEVPQQPQQPQQPQRQQTPQTSSGSNRFRIGDVRLGPKKKTSSVWSPHLRIDNRASRYSIWEPPSMTWSAESQIFGRRNIQVVLFIVGFIFPFAWMTASFLPLPFNTQFDIQDVEKGTSQSRLRLDSEPEPIYRRVDDSRYQSARWWRNVNRIMSFFGVLIIAVVIALVVVGTRKGWAR
ncbi:hypothetical protein GGS20DRAFT_512803 [Poronia punctata]|nr:hypothetical protein GGS20DRAFT_512803 [Poronia punctata]